jgi:hypothetical protein
MGNYELLVLWLVVAARFIVPLSIPRFPLPGILASLVLDAVDQTIFQQFPSLDLTRYQNYDKALDIYYLTIAYISTLRNWKNYFAFQVGRFLFYWRLVGVALFELTQLRVLLLIFPNTFEYFFIFYETYRLRWDPRLMSKQLIIAAAALIWVVIKLPQEYWIHIAQIDTTDRIKTSLFGVPADTAWSVVINSWPGVLMVSLLCITLITLASLWFIRNRLPPADRQLAFSADAHEAAFTTEQVREAVDLEARQILDAALIEKVILVTLVSISFAHVLVGVQATDIELAAGVAFVVIMNTALSHWLARRGYGAAFTLQQFVVLVSVNSLVMLVYVVFRRTVGDYVGIGNALFFVILFSLLVTLFDHYRQAYLMRINEGEISSQNPGEKVG